MSGKRALTSLALTLALAWAPALWAQSVGGSIQGSIKDPDGAILPGAQVVIRNVGTGAAHERTADAGGHYLVPLLQPGEYEVHFSLAGFAPVARRGIRLTVGQDALVDATLSLGQRAEEVVVQADVSGVNLRSGAVSGLVGEKEIRDLPLNGRSFQQLALLQPGVNAALAAGNDVVGGRTPKISINGARPEQNNFLLDGTDINNVYNKTPGSSAGVLLGVEAVLEFQVLTNAYSAEFGKSAGGVINAVTRSGANAVRGSVFGFHRNSAFDARSYFDKADKPQPDFTRYQFGATLGGPLRKDQTFYFLAYEGLIERLGITGIAAVPDDDARRGIINGKPVTMHPAIPAYLNLFPQANGRSLGGGAAEHVFSPTQPTDEHFFQGRIDHSLSPSDSLFVRYTYDKGKLTRIPPNKPFIAVFDESTENHYATVEHKHTFSPSVLNILRAGLNRSSSLADTTRTIDIPPSLSWLPGQPFGFLTIQSLGWVEMGGDIRLPRNDWLNNWQLGNTLILTSGRHSARVGFQGQYIQFDQESYSQRGGVVNFADLPSFLAGKARSVDFAVPGLIDPWRHYRQWFWGFFVQDDVRLGSRLSANLGLRYEFVTVPHEVDGKISNLRNVTDSQLAVGEPWHSNPSLENFAPRLGFAWDPFGSGKTSVRAGFGLFHDEILPKYYIFSGSLNPPFTTRTSIQSPPFPNVVANFDVTKPIRAQVQTVNYDLKTPYIMQFNFNVQRALPGGWDVMLGYVGSRGKNLIRLGDANLSPSIMLNGVKVHQPQLGRRNPNFGGAWQRMTDAESFYNSLQFSAQRRHANGWRAQVSYTLSRAVDNSSGINSQDFSNVVQYGMDWYDLDRDLGLSAFHAKHNLTFNWSLDLPFARSSKGLKSALFKGWQLNNITTLRSGHPFTVQLGFNRSGNLNTTGFSLHERPDVKPGCSNNPILGGPDRYFDIDCFELPAANTYGNLGRNTLIGPGLVSIDLSLVKSFDLGRNRSLQLRVECFNVPNHPNFAIPTGRTAFTGVNADGSPIVAPTWGRITSTVTTSRQIQVGAKLTF